MFNWDLNTLLRRYIYREWRLPKFIAFVQSLGSPLTNLYTRFVEFKELWFHKLKFTDQIIYMEHYLNGEYELVYDLSTRDNDISNVAIIWIENADFIQSNTCYRHEENKSGVFTSRVSEQTEGNVTYHSDDYTLTEQFTVWVPNYINVNENHIRAKIAFYLKAGKQYSIKTY